MSELAVRVESIYDVSLAKVLQDEMNISLVNPSNDQQELLGADPLSIPHDVHIGDLDYRSGIQLKGDEKSVEMIEKRLRETLPDAIVFQHPIQQDAIYNARVTKYIYRKRLAILDLGRGQKGIMFNVKTDEGANHIVQIKELTTEKDKLPVCTETITLSGDYVILEVGSSFVRVSRKIKGEERTRLHNLGKEILPPGFGIIIRTSAKSVSDETIEGEIDEMRRQWEEIVDTADYANEPQKFSSGEIVSEIALGNASKVLLDKVRSSLTETIPNYHHFRAYSMASGFTADYAQSFIDKVDSVRLATKLEQMILDRDFAINNHVKAEFNYTDGKQEEYIIGNIIRNGDVIVTRTTIKNEDLHDEIPLFDVHEGDRLEIHFSYGSWTVHYKYYSGLTNSLLGEKLRIITPLDLVYRGRIRAFDMGMSIYKSAEGEITSEVDDSTADMVEKGMISKDLDHKLGEVFRVARDMLKNSIEEILIHLNL